MGRTNQTFRTAGRFAGAAACVAAATILCAPACAQELVADGAADQAFAGQLLAEPSIEPWAGDVVEPAATLDDAPNGLIYDPQVQPAASSYPGWEYEPGPAPVMSRQPVNWISGPYLKSGVTFVVGDDLFESQDVSYTISGGFRQALGPALDERLFFDVGGSYLSARGETTRPIAGTITTQLNGVVIDTEVDADLFNSTLKEVKRGSVHAAFGWYWGDPIDVRSNDPQLRIATRFGGRYGHMRGRFNEVAVGTPGANETFTFNYYGRTTTFGGLFVGTEAILLMRDTPVGCVAWTLDGEYANDWAEFGGWGRGALGTASLMLGCMLSR